MTTHYDPTKFYFGRRVPAPDGFLPYVLEPVPIRVPIAVVLGHYEKLSSDELNDLYHDIKAEYERREHHER